MLLLIEPTEMKKQYAAEDGDPVARLREAKLACGLDPKKPWPNLKKLGPDPHLWAFKLKITKVQAIRLRLILLPADDEISQQAIALEEEIETQKNEAKKIQSCSSCGDEGHNSRTCPKVQITKGKLAYCSNTPPVDDRAHWRPRVTVLYEYVRSTMPIGADPAACFQYGMKMGLKEDEVRNALAWAHYECILWFAPFAGKWRTTRERKVY